MRTSTIVAQLSQCFLPDACALFDLTSAQLREYATHLSDELDRRVPNI